MCAGRRIPAYAGMTVGVDRAVGRPAAGFLPLRGFPLILNLLKDGNPRNETKPGYQAFQICARRIKTIGSARQSP